MFGKAMEAGNRTTGRMGGKCNHGEEEEHEFWGCLWPTVAEASGSSSGTRLAAPPSLKPSLGADLAFHLNLASTRKSPGTRSAGSGDSTVPLATAVGESWAGWFYSHCQKQCWVNVVGGCLEIKSGMPWLCCFFVSEGRQGMCSSHPTLQSMGKLQIQLGFRQAAEVHI